MKRRIPYLLTLALGATVALAGVALAAHKGGTTEATATPDSITYNCDRDARAEATLSLQGNRLHVEVDASGLEPGKVHPQHIHGFGKGKGKKRNASCPTGAQDDNGDGVVDVPEGLETYGQILIPLDEGGSSATAADGQFPVADETGSYHFEETYKVKRGQLTPLENRHIVIHGAFPPDKYEPAGDDAPPADEYWASLPVACGQIR
ncbi:MAG: hypothetical protein ACR2LH_07820 [Thermoleophilaceae bacterium]